MTPEQEIAHLFELWNDAIRTGDPDRVVELYADDAILLPTVSDRVRHNPGEIRDYFEHFLPKKPAGKIDEANIRVLGDTAINSGLYTFTLASGPVKALRGRFTFVYKRAGDRWLIVEHHSSVMPEQYLK